VDVKDSFPGRGLFTLEALGVRVQGTCHLPRYEIGRTEAKHSDSDVPGILLLSGLLSPRTAVGDSMVYWANSFAKAGYKCFRVDLPGSCDSGGDAPAELTTFINSGGYEAVTIEILKQIVARYSLSSMVIMGHCSGAVTAVYAAAGCKYCHGLILTEPYFHLLPPAATKTREVISDWAGRNRFGGVLSDILDRFKELRLRLRTSELPGNANFPLLERWSSLASSALPILVLKVPGPKASGNKPRVGEFDYLEYVADLAGARGRVEMLAIEGVLHSFADRIGRAIVRDHGLKWLSAHFPPAKTEVSLPVDLEVPSKAIQPMTVTVKRTNLRSVEGIGAS
jgi:pimeloyl-ACP methyl ester carboxylesterase